MNNKLLWKMFLAIFQKYLISNELNPSSLLYSTSNKNTIKINKEFLYFKFGDSFSTVDHSISSSVNEESYWLLLEQVSTAFKSIVNAC